MSDKKLSVGLLNAKIAMRKNANWKRSASGNRNRFATLDDIDDYIFGPLVEQGIRYDHYLKYVDGNELLVTYVEHVETLERIEDERILLCEKPGNQSKGGAQTYARRYALQALFGLPQEEDDDCQSEQDYINNKLWVINTIKNHPDKDKLWKEIKTKFVIVDLNDIPEDTLNEIVKYLEGN